MSLTKSGAAAGVAVSGGGVWPRRRVETAIVARTAAAAQITIACLFINFIRLFASSSITELIICAGYAPVHMGAGNFRPAAPVPAYQELAQLHESSKSDEIRCYGVF
jgi:hypothetical protein